MKNKIIITGLLCLFWLLPNDFLRAQVAINSSGETPDSTAMLDISSTDKGLLTPRMTTTQREMISSPATGLLVFDTTQNSFWYYSEGWKQIPSSNLKFPTGLGDSTQVLSSDGHGNLYWGDNEDAQNIYLANDSLWITNGDTISLSYLKDASQLYLIANNTPPILDVAQESTTAWGMSNNREWQSFTSSEDGILSQIDIRLFGNFDDPGFFYLVKGQGFQTDTLLVLDSIDLNFNWNTLQLDTFNTRLEKDEVYTFIVGEYNSTFGIYYASNNPYLGGRSSRHPNLDYVFRTYIRPDTIVNNIFQVNTTTEQYGMTLSALDTLYFTNGTYQTTALPNPSGTNNQILTIDENGSITWDTLINISSAFDSQNGLTASLNNNDNFVFGANSLNHSAGAEYKFFFDQGQGAFRVGLITNENWNTDSLGLSSFATGADTKASGDYSIALGTQTTATAFAATALGAETTASGLGAFAAGNQTVASGSGAIALGSETSASKLGATALGTATDASEIGATAIGNNSTASGLNSTALGFETVASGENATAFGAITSAEGLAATAFGSETTASGTYATAFGSSNEASGTLSTAFGYLSIASGGGATSLGLGTKAPSYAETAIGAYNTNYTPNATTTFDSNDRLFVVGNGTGFGNQSDALSVYKNGNMELNGALTINDNYTFPTVDGTAGQVLSTDGAGNVSWVSGGSDNLGSHTATQNIQLAGNWLSNDGGNEGISIDNTGNVGIGTDQPDAKLDIDGELLLSGSILDMGLITELETTAPIMNMALNVLTPSVDASRLGGMFRIDSRNQSDDPLFQWIEKPVGSSTANAANLLMSLDNTGLKMKRSLQLSGNWLSNDGGSEGLSINNDGIVNTSSHLGIGGHLTAQNYIGIGNDGQSLTLAADELNNRIILDVGGSGHSGDAIVLGELGTGSKNPVLMQGNLAVGTLSPPANYKLVVNGQPAANGFTQFTNYSDRRLKQNIQPINSALDRLTQLRPVSFRYNEKTGYDSTALATTFHGFIAQELQAIFPEMVGDVQLNGDTYLDANLSSLPVYLVKAMQEQQVLIDALMEVNQTQQAKIETLQAQVAKIDQLEVMLQQMQDASATHPTISSNN
ncbi:MAG: tail fiber domain-containing protein [Bacteroidota bacterium]